MRWVFVTMGFVAAALELFATLFWQQPLFSQFEQTHIFPACVGFCLISLIVLMVATGIAQGILGLNGEDEGGKRRRAKLDERCPVWSHGFRLIFFLWLPLMFPFPLLGWANPIMALLAGWHLGMAWWWFAAYPAAVESFQ